MSPAELPELVHQVPEPVRVTAQQLRAITPTGSLVDVYQLGSSGPRSQCWYRSIDGQPQGTFSQLPFRAAPELAGAVVLLILPPATLAAVQAAEETEADRRRGRRAARGGDIAS